MRYSTVSGGSEADFRVDFWAAASFMAAAAADVDMMMVVMVMDWRSWSYDCEEAFRGSSCGHLHPCDSKA